VFAWSQEYYARTFTPTVGELEEFNAIRKSANDLLPIRYMGTTEGGKESYWRVSSDITSRKLGVVCTFSALLCPEHYGTPNLERSKLALWMIANES
jgi:hypothetical protein